MARPACNLAPGEQLDLLLKIRGSLWNSRGRTEAQEGV